MDFWEQDEKRLFTVLRVFQLGEMAFKELSSVFMSSVLIYSDARGQKTYHMWKLAFLDGQF